MVKLKPKHTLVACFAGYITQAIVNNFAPLLFLTFHESYGISLTLIGAMITLNFGVQITVDLLATKFADRIGYRATLVGAHLFAAAGLLLLGILPNVLPVPVVGIFTASAIYSVGGGLIEVMVSPVVEACPFENKKSVMNVLHSFYCWGQVGVVALSTLYFFAAGTQNWAYLAWIWAALPLLNAVLFLFVPIYPLVEEGQGMGLKGLLRSRMFWFFVILMICSGGSESVISQWSSALAESGLQVPKAVGDLLGPCLFAVCMGTSRVLMSKFGGKLKLKNTLLMSAVGCVAGYALCAFSPVAWPVFVGCGLVGFSSSLMWPGVFSYASAQMPKGGTAMFALLSLAGDIGCMTGPSAAGAISDAFAGNLQAGIAFALIFPAAMLIVLLIYREKEPKNDLTENLLKNDSE